MGRSMFHRAGRKAGSPKYSLRRRYYPDWMPDTPKGISQPLVHYWHMKRRLLWALGYISIDGKRSDQWTTFSPEKMRRVWFMIDLADEKLKEGERIHTERLKEEKRLMREGVMSKIFEQTEAFIENRKNSFKQCLNNKEEIDMSKMTFDEMMEWSKKVKDYDSGFNFLKFPQGIHFVRIITSPDENYFRSYTQHDCGTDKSFRTWLCWDYIMDNKEVREYYAEKELLTEADDKKAKRYGDPICSTLEVIKKYVKDMEQIYKSLRTKTRCIMNAFYICQAYPANKTEKTPRTGLYILEQSAAFNKLIISAMGKDGVTNVDGDGEEDALQLLSIENGKFISVQADGDGIGKDRRSYTIDFKGKSGPLVYCEDGANPYKEGKANRITLPEDFQIYDLREAEALRFLSYQETINQLKSIESIKRIIDQIGYEIPGDEPSDNPLDDNYDKSFAQKTVGKPIAVKKINQEAALSKIQKPKEKWEDEDDIEKDKKIVAQAVDMDDDDIPFDDDFDIVTPTKKDAFEKAVPKSDPAKEVITNAPKGKRKIF